MNIITRLRNILTSNRGSAVLWLPGITILAILIAGLVYDTAGQIQTHNQAAQIAASAARAGTAALSPDTITSGSHNLDPGGATRTVNQYLATQGVTGHTTVNGQNVTVTVDKPYKTVFVSIIGVNELATSATETARLIDAP